MPFGLSLNFCLECKDYCFMIIIFIFCSILGFGYVGNCFVVLNAVGIICKIFVALITCSGIIDIVVAVTWWWLLVSTFVV